MKATVLLSSASLIAGIPPQAILSLAVLVVLTFALWLLFGPQAQRRQAFRRGHKLLGLGKWQQALEIAQRQQQRGRLSPLWAGRLRNLEGECYRAAAEAALGANSFEQALQHFNRAADLLSLNPGESRERVLETMLEEIRRLFSLNSQAETQAALELAVRLSAMAPENAEALFWSALCQVRQGRIEPALTELRAAHDKGRQRYIDPPLYLGALLLHQGAAAEAVRFLAEANRLAPASPFVTGQLGIAMVAAGGDSQLAVWALQRALERFAALAGGSPGRLPSNGPATQRAWLEGLPEAASFVHRLAARHPFPCPVLGNLTLLIRQLRQALAEASYRSGNYAEAARLYAAVLAEAPPTAPLLSGLGRALVRLERYEEAYNHLRSAYDREDPKDPYTAGYLALCAARAKPAQPVDRARNVAWAVDLVAAFDRRDDGEWAELVATIHAEAHALGLPVAPEQQLRLCQALASVQAMSPAAAAAYDHLAASFPELMPPDLVSAQLAAHDRAAAQHYRQGDLSRSIASLIRAHQVEPHDPLPLVRRAVLECQLGHREEWAQAIRLAMERATGQKRAAVAFLGARLALAGFADSERATQPDLELAVDWLLECLKDQPEHADALWCLAAVRCLKNDRPGLGELASRLQRPNIADPRFQFMAACSALETKDGPGVREAARRAAAAQPRLAADCSYLAACAHLQAGEETAAPAALEQAARAPQGHAREHARARLGCLEFNARRFDQAIRWWQEITPEKRAAWGIDVSLRQTLVLLALEAYEAGQFDRAVSRLRTAQRAGLDNGCCQSILVAALIKNGQELLHRAESETGDDRARTLARAANALDEAVQVGGPNGRILGQLARAHRLQGQLKEARSCLRRIPDPDALVLGRLAELSLEEGRLDQAEPEFAAAWAKAPDSYAVAHNLLRTRLSLGQIESALPVLSRAVDLCPAETERRSWQQLLSSLELSRCPEKGVGSFPAVENTAKSDSPKLPTPFSGQCPALVEMSSDDEQRLLQLIRTLGHLESSGLLLSVLRRVRPGSVAVRDAWLEARLLRGKKLLDRCDWSGARKLLESLRQEQQLSPGFLAALLNLLGCCACLEQDFDAGVKHFQTALELSTNDARIVQNLALAHEWQGQAGPAEKQWKRFFELVDHSLPAPAGLADYGKRLASEGLHRLVNQHADKEQWQAALAYARQALELHPGNPELLERLFQLYQQAGEPDEARRALQQLRRSRAREPLLDLYELELIDLSSLDGMEKFVGDLDRLLRRNPGDGKIESRARALVGTLHRLLEKVQGQLADQVGRVLHQVRHLPRHQIDWSAVHDVLRDLRGELQRLRRVAVKAVQIDRDDEQRGALRGLIGRIDRKIDQCRSMGG